MERSGVKDMTTNTNATNRAVATVTNAMTIAGLEMLMQPDLNQYVTAMSDRFMQQDAKRRYRIKAIKRVLQSELDKPSVMSGDPAYYIILMRFRDLPDHELLDNIETLPFVGSRGHESPAWKKLGNGKAVSKNPFGVRA
jgi:hypothetical protein